MSFNEHWRSIVILGETRSPLNSGPAAELDTIAVPPPLLYINLPMTTRPTSPRCRSSLAIHRLSRWRRIILSRSRSLLASRCVESSDKDTPDSEAAQEFHWDMERIRWIRFFIYLTDVTVDNGPHCFIKGTHRTGAIPDDLLKQGYVRQKDEILLQRYGNEAYLEFTGPRGTIIAEDSRGWHKGKMPRKGDRLLLAFELCNTTFGANKRHVIRNIHVPRFGEFVKRYPRIYANFDFAPGVLR